MCTSEAAPLISQIRTYPMLMAAAGLAQRGNTWSLSAIIPDPLALRLHIRFESAFRDEAARVSVYCTEIICSQESALQKKKVIASFYGCLWIFWHSEMFTKGKMQSSRPGFLCFLSLSSTEPLHLILRADSLPAPPPLLHIFTHL